MSHASLANRYRPQSFAEVTGQDTVKAILSRAAVEDRVAPAYLLSGTRGVGKTTIARIFAKALNCEHAPVAEPCNQCEQCRRITQGNHVDVVEIDGASNRGIDDARRLREAIAYAPMEGRYKVFIIDEAHMLTRESFNALLKTLEEPPPRATFILATTEAHKFPVTIVSRCQHLVFKAIPETELGAHLIRILNREKIPFEEDAVRLLARRAAGSVRDSMSLLGQTLALGGDALTEAATRSVLGLAGQELYERLLRAFKAQDCLAVSGLTKELLEQGVDLGFFLRELTTLWRNLFLLRQAGEAAAAALDMPEGEKKRLIELAPLFDVAYIHAAWQMVLENQRQVLTSLEPSAALELLLLNLTLLPRLVSLEMLSGMPPSGPGAEPSGSACTPSRPVTPGPRPAVAPPVSSRSVSPPPGKVPERPAHPVGNAGQGSHLEQTRMPFPSSAPDRSEKKDQAVRPALNPNVPGKIPVREQKTESGASDVSAETAPEPDAAREDWRTFLEYCARELPQGSPLPMHALEPANGVFSGDKLTLVTTSSFQYEQLRASGREAEIGRLASGFMGKTIEVQVEPPAHPRKTEADLKKAYAEHPLIKTLEETFDAALVRCTLVERREP